MEDIGTANTNLGYLLGHADNPDEEWAEKVIAQTMIIQLGHELIASQTPPDEVAHIHAALLDVTLPLSEAMIEFLAGMGDGDAVKIARAVELMEESQAAMPVFEELMDEYLSGLQETSSDSGPTAPVSHDDGSAAMPKGGDPSGALGLDRATWEQDHVMTGKDALGTQYDDSKFLIHFMDDRLWYVEQPFGDDELDLAGARDAASYLLPSDAVFVETYSPAGFPELVVDLYMSDWLAEQFDADLFTGGQPGNFVAVYGVFDGTVPRVILGIGNNP